MKRLIIALLLVISSAQGLGAAAGINILNASRAFAHLEDSVAHGKDFSAFAADRDADIDGLKLFSIAEELSDYVVLEPGTSSRRYQAPSVPSATWIPASIILPRALPPPRS